MAHNPGGQGAAASATPGADSDRVRLAWLKPPVRRRSAFIAHGWPWPRGGSYPDWAGFAGHLGGPAQAVPRRDPRSQPAGPQGSRYPLLSWAGLRLVGEFDDLAEAFGRHQSHGNLEPVPEEEASASHQQGVD